MPHKAVLAAALDPIITIDGCGVIQSASDSVERVFGWKPIEVIGENVSLLMPEPHRSAHDSYLDSYRETGRTEHLNRPRQFEAVRKDGTFFPIEVSVSRANVPDQTEPLFVGIIRDLSDPARRGKLTEAPTSDDLPHSVDDSNRLYELLSEQTAALQAAHLRLRMADRMASIGALAAGLGHDMNNVLLPVRAHLNAVRQLTMIPQVRAHVEAVQGSVTYLQQLADGLHFLTQDTDTDMEIAEPVATDVLNWWSHVGPLLTKAVPKHVTVKVSFPADLPPVGISTHGLTQAVLNLVVNAGQAIPKDRKRKPGIVHIRAKSAKGGTQVNLEVADNGVGMSAEVQRNAFEMFYTTKARGLGTGLGLPLVARVLERSGGSVQIKSQLGKGTSVTILLPVAGEKTQRSRTLMATVTMKDERAATLIRHLLEMSGVLLTPDISIDSTDIWVLEPANNKVATAKAWRQVHPHGGLILFGKPSSRLARVWNELNPVVIDDRDNLDEIGAALSRAILEL